MFNYCIFVIIWLTGTLLLVSRGLAGRLGKAFANVREMPAIEPPIEVASAGSRVVLQYARPKPKKPSVYCRRPWLAGVWAVSDAVGFGWWPLVPVILTGTMVGILWQYAVAAMVMGTAALLGVLLIVWRGVRRVDGIPAAADWPKRKLRNWVFCAAAVGVLALVVLDMGTMSRLRRLRNEMNAQSQSLYIPVPEGTPNAAVGYREGFALVQVVPDWVSHESPTPPPVLSAELERAVLLLREASGLPVVDWGIEPQSSNYRTSLPHLSPLRSSANLLRIHAAREAQAGRVDAAICDIHAIRGIARHAGQGQGVYEGLVAFGVDSVAYAATEDVLPFITDDRLLGQLAGPPDDWYQKLRGRTLRGEQAIYFRTMVDIYEGKMGVLTPTASVADRVFILTRVFFADTDAGACRTAFDETAGIAEQHPDAALPAIRRLDARVPAPPLSGGLLTAILMSSMSQPVKRGIEAELLRELNTVGLAARRVYLRTGRLPGSLDELVTMGLLDRVPTDPFSGKPIRMMAKADDIIIYSVGKDGRDDGGDSIRGRDVTFRVGTKPLWEIDQARVQQEDTGPTSRP